MRLLPAFGCALALNSTLAFCEVPEDPETWYRDHYAPLWFNTPGNNISELRTFYASEIVTHNEDGSISRESQQQWLVEPMQGWLDEGWLRAELTALNTHPVNASTVAFVGRWLDHYEDGVTEVSCGWYLADAMDGRWVFTESADVDCTSQSFK